MSKLFSVLSSFLISSGISMFWYWGTTGLNKSAWSELEIILVTIIFPIVLFFLFFFTLLRFMVYKEDNNA